MRYGEALPIFVVSGVDGNNRTVAAIYEHAGEVVSFIRSVQDLGAESTGHTFYSDWR
jgi:hypothetical protein